ncbi:MAG: HAMP domain-containing protein [Planctomycetota bacterium]
MAALRNRLLGFGLVLLALVALTAWWAARGLVRPVEQVREAAQALADGDLGARVTLQRNDEIGDLATSFDRMAERIEEDQREIRARHQENEALLLNILPRPIATRLKQGEGQIADAFRRSASSSPDLVESTKLSSVTHPTELVALLNELFTEFDEPGDAPGHREDQDHRRLLHGRMRRALVDAGARHGPRRRWPRRSRWRASTIAQVVRSSSGSD